MKNFMFLFTNAAIMAFFGSSYMTAADTVIRIADLDQSKVTETVIPVAPEPVPEPEPASASVAQAPAPVVRVTAPAPIMGNSISVAGRTISIVDVADTSVDAGDHINKYGDKFLYGHNSAAVFGGLAGLSVGQTFSVNYNGSVTTYQIANMVTLAKNFDYNILEYPGSTGLYNYIPSIAKRAQFGKGATYDLALMTCAGASVGNGDATHRLVVFANKI